jgi:hypothetical protein
MKITESDYSYLKSVMLKVKDGIPAHVEFLKQPENLAKIKDFDTRLRWDWFNFAMRGRTSLLNKLYDYLNDEHIDSALKKIIKEIYE